MYDFTVKMDNPQQNRVRPYIKSSISRLRWTPELHHHFVKVVHNLGGKYKATPKKIMQMMAIKGLKISHVKSHLQMYRGMNEQKDLKGFIAMKERDQKPYYCTNWLPDQWQFSQGERKNVFYHEYQVDGAQGNSTSTLKRKAEISRANTELQGASELNLLGLLNLNPINLDLTMSLQ